MTEVDFESTLSSELDCDNVGTLLASYEIVRFVTSLTFIETKVIKDPPCIYHQTQTFLSYYLELIDFHI